ncbi:MAG: hypothetical protein JW728_00470 [Candidatus Aureabacteria bacterium]|nr:hypothetical protein [Candidatus Auribacterota bacterium]
MKRILVLLSVLILASTWSVAQDEKTVVAKGMAAIRGSAADCVLRAKDEALNRALRNAVEQAVGSVIDSETMVQNFQLLDDQVYSEVKGYVKSYEIISDNGGEGDIYQIGVKAVVSMGRLRKNLQALNIVKEKLNKPRIMIIFSEMVDGMTQPGETVQTGMEKSFLSNGFKLIDKSQMEAVKARDATLYYENPAEAASLGRRFGAEVVIVGQATADLIDSSQPYGVSVFAYEAQATAKAIDVDTAQVIASDGTSAQSRGGGRVPTARESMKKSGVELASKMMDQIVENWRSKVYNAMDIQIVGFNADSSNRISFEKALEGIRGVKSVNERSFSKGVVVIDVTIDGSLYKGFEEIITGFSDVGIEVKGKTQNRIDIEFLGN